MSTVVARITLKMYFFVKSSPRGSNFHVHLRRYGDTGQVTAKYEEPGNNVQIPSLSGASKIRGPPGRGKCVKFIKPPSLACELGPLSNQACTEQKHVHEVKTKKKKTSMRVNLHVEKKKSEIRLWRPTSARGATAEPGTPSKKHFPEVVSPSPFSRRKCEKPT